MRSETKTLGRLSADADAMSDAIDTLQDAVDAAKALPSESEKAVAFHDNVLPPWTPCVPLRTTPRPSAVRIIGLCPATARCSTTSDLSSA